jgi:imidazolonepropionase-like amidohydrolase
MHRRAAFRNLAAFVVAAILAHNPPSAQAQPAIAADAPAVVFRDVRVFDGRRPTLSGPVDVLVRGGMIERIGPTPLVVADPAAKLTVIAGRGRVLMPGLIDNHWHTMLARPTPMLALNSDVGYLNHLAAAEARATLLRGFTSVRDLGGPSFSLKRAIDTGLTDGPRIYPSGAMISITGGHGDFRSPTELPRQLGGPLTRSEVVGGSMIADSPDEVRVRVREQLLLGASQIKLTAGGGVSSPHSPLDVSTFEEEELRAAVGAASNWGTYVGVHAYTPASIRRAIAAGVKVIEHAHLMDDDTAALLARTGTWLSFQPFLDEGSAAVQDADNRLKKMIVVAGTERAIALVKKHGIRMALGTDILFSAEGATRQGADLAQMGRWYKAPEVLVMLTGTNADLLKLAGLRDPYPGKIGVVEEGAHADLLLVEGNPLEDLNLIADPAKNFAVIMKAGKVYKDASGGR